MIIDLILNFFIGLIAGAILEFTYRSFQSKKIVKPLFLDYQMYGITSVFLYFLHIAHTPLVVRAGLILIFTILLEYIVFKLYFYIKGVRRWDYSTNFMNYKGIVCLPFSLFWLMLSLGYSYLVLPILFK